MKDNILVVVLAIIIVVLSSLLLGNVVATSLAPVNSGMGAIAAIQRVLDQKLDANRADIKEQLNNIDRRLVAIEAKLNGGVAAAKAPAGAGCGAGGPQGAAPDYNKVQDIPVGNSIVLGNKNAPITIIPFLDFQCPFCARFYPPIEEVLKAYPDKVKIVIKNYPLSFHPNALPSAKLALAANEQHKYYEMADLLMKNGALVTEEKIKEYAKTLGLNYDRLMADYKNKDAQWQKKIDADTALGNQVGVRGTPTIFINGRQTTARDVAAYKAEIDKILSGKK